MGAYNQPGEITDVVSRFLAAVKVIADKAAKAGTSGAADWYVRIRGARHKGAARVVVVSNLEYDPATEQMAESLETVIAALTHEPYYDLSLEFMPRGKTNPVHLETVVWNESYETDKALKAKGADDDTPTPRRSEKATDTAIAALTDGLVGGMRIFQQVNIAMQHESRVKDARILELALQCHELMARVKELESGSAVQITEIVASNLGGPLVAGMAVLERKFEADRAANAAKADPADANYNAGYEASERQKSDQLVECLGELDLALQKPKDERMGDMLAILQKIGRYFGPSVVQKIMEIQAKHAQE